MKLKMTVTYGEEVCEAIKQSFGRTSDEELLIVFRAVARQSLAKDSINSEDLDFICELVN